MVKKILVAGPTASGKSEFALRLADALQPFGGATIINSDSLQLYRDLQIITARPSSQDEQQVPHRLYGIFSSDQRSSAGRWLELATDALEEVSKLGHTPIIVGGTGLYFQALLEGLAPVPNIPEVIRVLGRKRLEEQGNEVFYRDLTILDPIMASKTKVSDSQRLLRAWEVITATGESLAVWQKRQRNDEFSQGANINILLMPERPQLYARCNARFEAMSKMGAVEEVIDLMTNNICESHPLMKAVGVTEIMRYLSGEIDFSVAVQLGQQATRRYAKRQMTWFKSRMSDWYKIDTEDLESVFPEIVSFVQRLLLTP